ncbi:DUF4386 domain-containing protein [Maritalea porphyrae]|mgnify:CR=1 FL=1|jgi:hypothetical protein|uniref:DUF4386 domain-containing protein n=1 Tax=Maritalea porphyrae TaxID=880732 RepID=UPI0022AE7E75|nr:DUF4386 domain-containing protein [Maritalea porphyrae]MCZ4273705.1 DUF4386 domain-containing protein [Maritalea porphyrae]
MAALSISNPRQLTIWAAICYLVLLVAGPIGLMYMPEQIVVAGDATQTAQNLRTNMGTFHLGLMAQIAIVFTEVILTALLFVLMKPAGRTTALMATFARLAMTVVMTINLLPLLMMAEAANGAAYLASFSPAQLDSLVLLFFQFHNGGTIAWQLLFALHMLLLGILVFRSTYLPRILGLALIIGSPSYALDSFGQIFGLMDIPAYGLATNALLGASAVGEVGLAIWFLFKGVNLEKWRQKNTA